MAVLREAEAAGHLEVVERFGMKPAELCQAIADYDALIVRSASTVTRAVLDAARRLRVIGRAGIGVDNIDVAAATQRGVAVINTPGGNNVTTAEHAISMLLALTRSIPQATASMKAGKWEKGRFTGSEVCNKLLGIVGLGNIGYLVAERAQALKMRVIAFDPFVTEEKARAMGVELDLSHQATILIVAMLTSKGASGVSGAGFITLAATLMAVDPQLAPGMSLVLGVDKFMSECRALTNFIGNGVAAIVVAAWEGELDRARLTAGLARKIDPSDVTIGVTTD